MLECSDLDVSYGRIAALKGVRFRVSAGGIVSIIGANGAGKTTLLRAV
jgi:branched-chain amino acid transport system ATP-binding protein